MTRKLKAMGLALMAVFAMSAVMASAASATNDILTPEASPMTLTGTQEAAFNNKFTVAGQAVECETATYHATVTGTSLTQVTGVTPTYGNCKYGPNVATIFMNGCTYTLKGATDTVGTETHATAAVVCPAGSHIEITVHTIHCIITVKGTAVGDTGSQTATKGYTITTVGSGATRELLLHLTATVKVSHDNDPPEPEVLACQNIVGNGVLTGTVKITGETDTGTTHTGITDSQ